jgi:hypothetical protein
MLERFEANLGDLDGFTVIAGGLSATFPALPDSGLDLPQILLAPLDTAEADPAAAELLYTYTPNVRRLANGLRGADFAGPIERNGARVYVLTTDSPAAILGTPEATDADAQQTTLSIFVDAATFDVREIHQSVQVDSLERPLSVRFLYEDFREVEGASFPFRVRLVREGFNQLIPEGVRMVQGGQLGYAMEQARSQRTRGPEQEARAAELERQFRALTEGIEEQEMTVQEIRVTGAGAEAPTPES